MPEGRIVVVGASAGGIEALIALVASLPPDFAAPVLVVQHLSPDYVSILPQILSRNGPLPALSPRDGDILEPGRIYVAPPDHHLLVRDGRVLVKKGPKENRFRPSVDALFRSAAYSHGPQAIGIVLSGQLDDGTSGLWSIKCMGGVTIVQDPAEAAYDSMPSSALEQVDIDHCISINQMGELLQRLTEAQTKTGTANTEDQGTMEIEVGVAAGDNAFKKGIMTAGPLTPFTCPDCHGVLVQIREGKINRFRCHTGHAYSANALLSATMERVEDHYEQAMAILEEAAILLNQMGSELVDRGQGQAAARFFDQSQLAAEQSSLLRDTMQDRKHLGIDSLLDKGKRK